MVLFVGRREQPSDVAEGTGAQQGVDQGVNQRIPVGMRLRTQGACCGLDGLTSSAQQLGATGFKLIASELDPNDLLAFAKELASQPNNILVLTARGPSGRIIIARSANIPADQLNCSEILRSSTEAATGSPKVGGKPDFAQGGGFHTLAAVRCERTLVIWPAAIGKLDAILRDGMTNNQQSHDQVSRRCSNGIGGTGAAGDRLAQQFREVDLGALIGRGIDIGQVVSGDIQHPLVGLQPRHTR